MEAGDLLHSPTKLAEQTIRIKVTVLIVAPMTRSKVVSVALVMVVMERARVAMSRPPALAAHTIMVQSAMQTVVAAVSSNKTQMHLIPV